MLRITPAAPSNSCPILAEVMMILFKQRFRQDLLNGNKTTTLRAWKRRLAKPGTVTKTNLGISLFVEFVGEIALTDIDDGIDRAAGFESVDALVICLREIYPNPPQTLTLVRFRLAN